MSVIMEQQTSTNDESAVQTNKVESNNNNHQNNRQPKQSLYDVLGNDQEMAKRQFLEDEDEEDDEANDRVDSFVGAESNQGKLCKNENSDVTADECQANGASDTNRQRATDENYPNTNSASGSYPEEYNYSSNGSGLNDHEMFDEEGRHKQQQEQHLDEPEQLRKLFIGGLDYKTSEATLKEHFEKFGDVIDCVVMREPQSKRSRGFGFVIYANSTMVDKAQDARPHEVDGREVQSKRAISREDSGKPEAQATVKKVYLGGLSDDIEESELREYFKEFGTIVNVNIVVHKDTGRRRGFAFVEYDDYDPVDKIVLKKFHTVKDKRIEAKKAIPKVEMDARKRGDPRASMAGAMIALTGLPMEGGRGGRPRPSRNTGANLWDGPYNGVGYPHGYSGQANLDGYGPHYHSPSTHYGGASSWMTHEGHSGGPYGGFRNPHEGGYGRSSYANQASGWTNDYNGFPASQGAGPMRLSYQHRSLGPYGGGYGAHRGRGYNP